MSLIVCKKCGEEYSDRYSACPFCAEAREYATRGRSSRAAGHHVARRKSPSILGPAMILVLLALLALLLYFFMGDGLRGLFHRVTREPVVVTMDEIVLDLEVGSEKKLSAFGAETFTWSSSDPAVAAVSSDGLVTAIGAGSATVSVTAEGVEDPAKCLVTVTEPVVDVEIVLDQASLVLMAGNSNQLSASGAESYVWSSNNTSVVTVGNDGTVTAVSEGSAVITVKDANSEAAASCLVTVNARKEEVDVSKLRFMVGKYELRDGQSVSYPFDGKANGGKGAFPTAKVSLTGTSQSAKWSVNNDSATLTENSDGSVSVRYNGSRGAVVALTASFDGGKVTLNLNFSK